MAETTNNKPETHRKELIGLVVSTKMQKTIVVQVERQKAHAMYGRVMSRRKKFYAHDEDNTAHVGDYVKIEETRPLSKLKRWKLSEVLRRSALAPEVQEVAS
jgi:small subunit ribosomal protein S17